MISQAQIFITQGINIGKLFFSGTCPGMLQHAFDNGIGALAVLIYFTFIIRQVLQDNLYFFRIIF